MMLDVMMMATLSKKNKKVQKQRSVTCIVETFLPPATKLRQGNVFTPVYHSVHRGVCHTPPWADIPLGQTPPPVQCMLGYGQHTGGTHSTGMQSCLSGPLCFVGFTMQLPNRTGFTTIWRIKCTTFQFRLLQGEFMDGLVPSVTQVTSQPRLGQIQRRINELCNYQR